MSNAQLVTVCPVLPAHDPQASAKWYCAKLGFRLRNDYGTYTLVSRDDVELHFWKCDDPSIAKATSIYVRCLDVAAVFASMQEASDGGALVRLWIKHGGCANSTSGIPMGICSSSGKIWMSLPRDDHTWPRPTRRPGAWHARCQGISERSSRIRERRSVTEVERARLRWILDTDC